MVLPEIMNKSQKETELEIPREDNARENSSEDIIVKEETFFSYEVEVIQDVESQQVDVPNFNYPKMEGSYQFKNTQKERKCLKQKRSPIWMYYNVCDNNRARCSICGCFISTTGGSVYNLRRHLKAKHKEIKFEQMLAIDKKFQVGLGPKLSFKKFQENANEQQELGLRDSSEVLTSDIVPANYYPGKENQDCYAHQVEITTSEDKFENFNVTEVAESPRKITKPKSSKIWKYFTECGRNRAKCFICNNMLSTYGGSTYNLLRHMKSKHKEINIRQGNVGSPTKNQHKLPVADGNIEENSSIETNAMEAPLSLDNDENPGIHSQNTNVDDQMADDTNLQDESKKIKRVKTSPIWNHFSEYDNRRAKCNICGCILSVCAGSLFGLKRHLIAKHKNVKLLKKQKRVPKAKVEKEYVTNVNQDEQPLLVLGNYNGVMLPVEIITGDVTVIQQMGNQKGDSENTEEQGNAEVESHINQLTPIKKIVKPKHSQIWKYFSEYGRGLAKCNICSYIFSYSGSTCNLLRHVKLKHKEIKIGYKESRSDGQSSTTKKQGRLLVGEEGEIPHEVISEVTIRNCTEENEDAVKKNQGSNSEYRNVDGSSEINEPRERRKISKPKTSLMWIYFKQCGRELAKCNICGVQLSTYGGSTCNLLRHMKVKHKEVKIGQRSSCLKPDSVKNPSELNKELGPTGETVTDKASEQNQSTRYQSVYANSIDGNVAGRFQNKKLTQRTKIMKLKSSPIWIHFDEFCPGRARCNICGIVLSIFGSSTCNLLRHIKRKHKQVRLGQKKLAFPQAIRKNIKKESEKQEQLLAEQEFSDDMNTEEVTDIPQKMKNCTEPNESDIILLRENLQPVEVVKDVQLIFNDNNVCDTNDIVLLGDELQSPFSAQSKSSKNDTNNKKIQSLMKISNNINRLATSIEMVADCLCNKLQKNCDNNRNNAIHSQIDEIIQTLNDMKNSQKSNEQRGINEFDFTPILKNLNVITNLVEK